jgi:stage III sporulation protein AG
MGESKLLDFNNIKDKIFSKKGSMVLLIVGFVGIALILLSSFLPSGTAKTSSSTSSTVTTTAYAKQLESDLAGLVCQIDGVGRVQVMVTVENGVQYVYEQSQKNTNDTSVNSQSDGSTQSQANNDNEQNPVIMDNGSGGQQPLIKTELQPTVMGVVIVCDGGDNPVVQESIVNAVTTALSIPANHINVCKMSKK